MQEFHLNAQTIGQIRHIIQSYNLFEDSVLLFKIAGYHADMHIPLHADFGAIVCTAGEAEMSINFKRYKVRKGMMVLNSPRNMIQLMDSTPDYEGSVILISETFIRQTVLELKEIASEIFQLHLNPCIEMQASAYITFEKYYELIKFIIESDENENKQHSLRALIISLIYNLKDLVILHNKKHNIENARNHQIFNEFILLLSQTCIQEKRVGYYADKFHLTPKYFSNIIKQVSEKSAREWIDEYVLLEAQILLQTTTLSIQEIADRLAFANASFFSKYFKQHLAMSPKEYREKSI